ncbi:hypothetical protein BDP27DRAFT_1427198 [Rhodocollybia butyracea]|uniref:Uncharacterized protein n=1 Tax=Rhodocollybia butyracea TaxID=206335 RepID=A0A9P5PIB1_9AGAR|nr:hypothetical protein BDP27DRAFT_1427198 [Rhodocollybia butyracea]
MLYQHNFEASTTSISDVFNADGYRQLLDCKVKVDGCELPHSYFSEKHDVALSVFVDMYTVFRRKRRGPSATPLLVKNLNLPPQLRVLSENGMRDLSLEKSPYYYPLRQPRQNKDGIQLFNLDGQPLVFEWDANNLPYRTHESFAESVNAMLAVRTVAQRTEICKFNGIKNLPISLEWNVNIMDVPPCMNGCICLRILFQTLSHYGKESSKASMEEIGRKTADAVKDIPSAFVHRLPNIATDESLYTAESWSFWFMYLMPILMKDRFDDPVYYHHACGLKNIMFLSSKFTITRNKVNDLRKTIIEWVHEFKRLYFQYDTKRLPVCTLTIHIILYLCDDILFCGPSWSTWTLWGERFCGFLQNQVSSHSAPFANLTNRLIYAAYLTQIVSCFDLSEVLALPSDLVNPEDGEILTTNEQEYGDYILCPPRRSYSLSSLEYTRLVHFFAQVTGASQKIVKCKLKMSTSLSYPQVLAGMSTCGSRYPFPTDLYGSRVSIQANLCYLQVFVGRARIKFFRSNNGWNMLSTMH